MSNTLGKTNFWMGVVEDRNDPLAVGRCKIRVFGFHTDNLKELPTADLPWALPALTPNASKSFAAPRNGDYVIGFFSDGESGQVPIFTGVLPGITSQAPNTARGFSPQGTQTDPQLPTGQVDQSVGQPTIVPLARGIIANTAIAAADANRAHVCNFTAKMNLEMSTLKSKISTLMEEIRSAIKSLFEGTKNSPLTEEIKQKVDALKAEIAAIKRKAEDELAKLQFLKDYYDDLQALIAEIQSLPAEAQQLVSSCLLDAQNGLTGAIADIKEQTGINDIQQAITDINTQVSAGADAIASVTQQVQTITTQIEQTQQQGISFVQPTLP
jgi:predicted  nucleic acid-binding Zn-ribbon protein